MHLISHDHVRECDLINRYPIGVTLFHLKNKQEIHMCPNSIIIEPKVKINQF